MPIKTIIALFLFFAVATVSGAESTDEVYIVRKGDSVSKITKDRYGDEKLWRPLADYNGIENANYIQVEQQLLIPAKTELLSQTIQEQREKSLSAEIQTLQERIRVLERALAQAKIGGTSMSEFTEENNDITEKSVSKYKYVTPKADEALVRTGGDRAKVAIGSGMSFDPEIHEVREILLNTMDIEITREAQDALITLDFNLADVECVFYVRVEASEESVIQAAHSLGEKTITPETLKELLGPKLDAALRAVAARTEITELVQNRQEFADNINAAIGENLLAENGLVLEHVGIIRIRQTPLAVYDKEDRFNAQGIRDISEITTQMAVETEKLIMDKEVNIKQVDVNAEKAKLDLEMDLAFKQASQQREIVTYSYQQEAETTKFQYEMEQSVQEREYQMKQEVEKARIAQEQTIQLRDIEKNLAVETAQIDMTKKVQEAEIQKNLTVETTQIAQSQAVAERDIQKNLIVEAAQIAQSQAVMEREIEKVMAVEKAKIAQEQAIQEADIQRNLALEKARIDAEVELKRKEVEAEKEKVRLEEELAAAKAEHQQKLAEYTTFAIFTLTNVKANEIIDIVKKFLSEEAIVAVAEGKNLLIIKDVSDCIKDAETIIKKLDAMEE